MHQARQAMGRARPHTAVQVREPITEVAAPMRAPGEPACRKVVNHSASRTPGLMAEPRGKLTAPVPTNGERALGAGRRPWLFRWCSCASPPRNLPQGAGNLSLALNL